MSRLKIIIAILAILVIGVIVHAIPKDARLPETQVQPQAQEQSKVTEVADTEVKKDYSKKYNFIIRNHYPGTDYYEVDCFEDSVSAVLVVKGFKDWVNGSSVALQATSLGRKNITVVINKETQSADRLIYEEK